MADPITHGDGLRSDGQGHNSGLLRYRDDEAASHAAVTVDAFVDQHDALAVRIEPGDEARELIPHLARMKLVDWVTVVIGRNSPNAPDSANTTDVSASAIRA